MQRTFRIRHRVRLSETDALGVVYYGQYLTYFDVSRLELLRKVGITLSLLTRKGLGFVAAEASCRYHSSARFDEVLTLDVSVAKIGGSSVTYSHKIRRGRALVAEGRVTDVMVDKSQEPVEIPAEFRKKLSTFA